MINKDKISEAVKILRSGGLIGMPTETVYGLAADARNPNAVRKIFIAKNRPVNHPLIVHISDITQLSEWARDIPDALYLLADVFWPGPLTFILKKNINVSDLITGSQDTIGIRIPRHPIALELLKQFGSALAAPSANKFGRISPTSSIAVKEELGEAVDIILEGGESEVGVESTILDLSQAHPVILRPGMITAEEISAVLKQPVIDSLKNKPRVSGSFKSHYAPQTKAKLMNDAQITLFFENLQSNDLPLVFLARKNNYLKEKTNDAIKIIKMPEKAKDYAHVLYKILRGVDKKDYTQIIIESVPDDSEWDGVRDRLIKATFPLK